MIGFGVVKNIYLLLFNKSTTDETAVTGSGILTDQTMANILGLSECVQSERCLVVPHAFKLHRGISVATVENWVLDLKGL